MSVPSLKFICKKVLRKEYDRKRYLKNQKNVRDRQKKWRILNPNYNKNYYKENREDILSNTKNYYKENREYKKVYQRKYNFKMRLQNQGLPIPDEIVLPQKYISHIEHMAGQALKLNILDYTFKKIRPIWLINPKTGYRLEIDLWCEELELGIEISGPMHYMFMKKYHKNQKGFENQLYRDQVKRDTCTKLGITLFEHRWDEPISDLIEKVKIYIDLFY